MLSDGKDFNMSLVVSMGYCIDVVGEGGQCESTVYNSVQMFEPFQDRKSHFFGTVSLS